MHHLRHLHCLATLNFTFFHHLFFTYRDEKILQKERADDQN